MKYIRSHWEKMLAISRNKFSLIIGFRTCWPYFKLCFSVPLHRKRLTLREKVPPVKLILQYSLRRINSTLWEGLKVFPTICDKGFKNNTTCHYENSFKKVHLWCTHAKLNWPSSIPMKTLKTSGFLIFSRGIERDLHEMG